MRPLGFRPAEGYVVEVYVSGQLHYAFDSNDCWQQFLRDE